MEIWGTNLKEFLKFYVFFIYFFKLFFYKVENHFFYSLSNWFRILSNMAPFFHRLNPLSNREIERKRNRSMAEKENIAPRLSRAPAKRAASAAAIAAAAAPVPSRPPTKRNRVALAELRFISNTTSRLPQTKDQEEGKAPLGGFLR